MKTTPLKLVAGIQSFIHLFETTATRRALVLLAVILSLSYGFTSCQQELTLSSGKYVIVIPEAATETEKHAAAEFKRLLSLSHPVQIEIVADNHSRQNHEVVIGVTNRQLPDDTADLQRDGFTIQTDDSKLYIKGGSQKGTLYGVYSFFETYLGYRCYAPDAFVYPLLNRVSIAKGLHDTQIPVNTFRNDFYAVALNNQFYADWHKSQYNEPEWGLFVHTFDNLVPPKTFFKDHPEYYSLIDGKRNPKQLCLTNPDVLKIVIDSLTKRIKENPEALYWSVSQNDTDGECTCEACRAIDEANGSPAGTIITFVNKVAEQFPGKIISTLAYWYSVKPPTQVRPLPNVNIMLAPIRALRHITIEEDPEQRSFIENWGKISDNILLWDYVTNFAHYMTPFPELFTLQPNVQFFIKNGVVAHFPEGNYTSENGEFANLRSYLIAKILWNPEVDVEAEMKDFLKGYYQDAAPFIEQYIRITHEELKKSGIVLGIYQHPYDHYEKGFLRAELLERYEQLFDEAEASVKDNADVLLRVQTARLPLTYATFEIAKRLGTTDSRVFRITDNGVAEAKPAAIEKLKQFLEVCKNAKVTALNEGRLSPDTYFKQTMEFMGL